MKVHTNLVNYTKNPQLSYEQFFVCTLCHWFLLLFCFRGGVSSTIFLETGVSRVD